MCKWIPTLANTCFKNTSARLQDTLTLSLPCVLSQLQSVVVSGKHTHCSEQICQTNCCRLYTVRDANHQCPLHHPVKFALLHSLSKHPSNAMKLYGHDSEHLLGTLQGLRIGTDETSRLSISFKGEKLGWMNVAESTSVSSVCFGCSVPGCDARWHP